MSNSPIPPDLVIERQVNHIRLIQQLADHYTSQRGTEISTVDIRLALFQLLREKEDLRTVIDLSGLTLTFQEALTLLDTFPFEQFQNSIFVEGRHLPEDLLPQGYASIKNGGRQWRIHLNDADPWPSKPHAHVVGTTFVLDLSNGDFYDGRQFKRRISYKDLIAIRTKFSELQAFKSALPALTI